MATYKEDYTKEEDFMMWDLHRIRKNMAEDGITIDEINKEAEKYIKKNKLRVVKIISAKNDLKSLISTSKK